MIWRLAVAVCLLLWATPAQAQEPVTLPAYEQLIREALNAAQRNDRLGLEEVTRRIADVRAVRLTDGTDVPVDNGWLAQSLQASTPDLNAISERLGALVDALSQPDGVIDSADLARLQDILNAPPFSDPENLQSSWFEAFLDWLGTLLDALFRPITGVSSTTGDAAGWVLGILSLLVVVGALLYLLRGLRRAVVRDIAPEDDDPEANLSASSARDQAAELARSGDYRTAVRYMYLSALLWLDERNLLRYDRALTNREYLEQVRANPALRAQLAPIVDTFDRVWYGHTALDAPAFAAYEQQIERLRNTSRPAQQETSTP